ncbi:hypothetical protein K1T71_009791 [Dendrolimus kikuchii]|uniref:Uncharacterized protein n=1 Tax=Dendrolimus kikuchii TaxID=765133 RepID=A0ACC1CSP1_9NEOP|nr:hypothetical protein K1T71_009791 [Dendrolimus kikuchii]
MKAILLVVLCLAAMAPAIPAYDDSNLESMDVKQKQMFILKLLNYVTQPVMYKEIEDIGKSYKIEENVQLYSKNEVVKEFINLVKTGCLPQGEVFTLHIDRQLKEVVSMFHMLYYAKDFATFIKTACWMRLYLNEGMFVYALTVAVRQRQDCKGIVLPPPYEIYPYFFVRADVIQKAYLLKMKKGLLDLKLCDFYGIKKTEKDVYIIDENVYDKRVDLNDEDSLRYFTEDIGLNTYYYYFHVDYPFWMKDQVADKFKFRRFELTVYVYQQILARYYLERLSNGLGAINDLSWYKPVGKGFWPWMKLHNGVEIPVRYNNYVIAQNGNMDVINLVEVYEGIIKEAIIKGYVEINGLRFELSKPEDVEMLGKLIYGKIEKPELESNRIDAYRYLLIIMKAALGLNTMQSDKYFVVPTALDYYQTALRDPVFYQLQKRIINFVFLFKQRLPSYTKEELYFPGVKVSNVVTDKLVTYFDDYLMDMSNAVVLNEEELKKASSDMTFFVRKRRLNNEKFKVSIDVFSDKTVDSVVRIFLGPKYDELSRLIDINNNRMNFVELDSFMYKLTTGKNTIIRNSYEMNNIVGDRMMTRDLWKKLETVTDIRDIYTKNLKNFQTGFPLRLLLPKGMGGGMEMLLYVCVSPLKLVDNADMSLFDTNSQNSGTDYRFSVLLDKMPLGFPLDRYIDVAKFYTPNMKFVDVKVFHKQQVCNMKMKWDLWVMNDYNMVGFTPTQSNTYFVDTDLNVNTNDKTDTQGTV